MKTGISIYYFPYSFDKQHGQWDKYVMQREISPNNRGAMLQPNIEFLQGQFNELSFLCLNFDPYQTETPKEIQKLLQKYRLFDLDDPFMVTNRLLTLLDQVETQLKSLKKI